MGTNFRRDTGLMTRGRSELRPVEPAEFQAVLDDPTWLASRLVWYRKDRLPAVNEFDTYTVYFFKVGASDQTLVYLFDAANRSALAKSFRESKRTC